MLVGCAFDVIHLKQVPVQFEVTSAPGPSRTLARDTSVSLVEGWATLLKSGTSWHQVGRVPQGNVFATRDQVVTVEASNVHEAELVLSGTKLVCFYLPVERTFVAADPPTDVPWLSHGVGAA